LYQLATKMQEYALRLTKQSRDLDKAISVFDSIEDVTASVVECKGRLEEAKDELEITKLQVKRKKKLDSDLADAEAAVSGARDRYHESLRRLVELRQCGYPELSCVAATPSNDPFPNVPTVAFADLELGESIGRGAFSEVRACELPGSGLCAFKELKHEVAAGVLLKEASALWALRGNAHIVRLLKVCLDEGHKGLLLELADGGSLGKRLQQQQPALSMADGLSMLHSIALGLAAVHDCGHVHLDVKSDNVLLCARGGSWVAKLSDFGSSKAIAQTLRDTTVNKTFRWAAPELLQEPPVITSAADVWSFGMLCYEVATGKIPFHAFSNDAKVIGEIQAGRTPSVAEAGELGRIMALCFVLDPKKRPSMLQVVSQLELLMQRDCSRCFGRFALGKGLLSEADVFLCKTCLIEHMESLLDKDTELRSDGAVAWGSKDVFSLHRVRDVCDQSLFERWQAGQLRARDKELAIEFQRELDRAKAKWIEQDAIERLAQQFVRELFGSHARMYPCPNCFGLFEFESGCMAIRHKLEQRGCGQSFCGFCFLVNADSAFVHDHARTCELNTANRGQYDLPAGRNQQQPFHEVQRVRLCRELTRRFGAVVEAQREALLARLQSELDARKIRHVGRWRFE
jgi:serine/threonine protein kinase